MQCPRCQQGNRTLARFCDECGTPLTGAASITRPYAELNDENEGLRRSLSEALEQQTATSDVLRVISQSPTDIQLVLDAVAERAARLCNAYDAVILRLEGGVLRRAAHYGPIPPPGLAISPARSRVSGRAVLERKPVHVADAQAESEEFPEIRTFAREQGFRTILSVPLLWEDIALGTIDLRRTEVQPFTDTQIGLLKTFADQAVIAIENVRLFTELEERNRDLTATSEVLHVISRSPTDAQPVFEAIVGSAARLTGAQIAAMLRLDGDLLYYLAGSSPVAGADDAYRKSFPRPLEPGSPSVRAIQEQRVVRIPDVEQDDTIPSGIRDRLRLAGVRSSVQAPMIRDEVAIGVIAIGRTEPIPFNDRQVELLKTFADQAVIAIENVRLFTELEARNRDLTMALDQQTATAEILRAINSSPADVQPVFDTIVQSAARLCHAASAGVFLTDGRTLDLPANYGSSSPEALATIRAHYPRPLDLETIAGVAILTRAVIHVPDIEAPSAAEVYTRRIGRLLGVRSMVAVPMIRKGEVAGAINLGRQEPGRFSDMEVELLQTFAEQAVIAIENVRLFNEMKDALERQTATSEILRVISGSPTDVQPIFDAIVRNASQLCGGEWAIVTRYDRELLHLAAQHNPRFGVADTAARFFPQVPQRKSSITARAVVDGTIVHVSDVETEDLDPSARELYRRIGLRAVLAVPMVHEGRPIGVVSVSRGAPGLFSDRQVDLLQTFADQAVIAIENVRLFTELRASNRELTAALDKQTATSDILRAISQSQADVEPVFDTMLSRAIRLIGAYAGALTLVAGDHIRLAAFKSADKGGETTLRGAFPVSIGSESAHARAVRNRMSVNIRQAQTDPEVSDRGRSIAKAVGYHSMVVVPLLHHELVIGTISAVRREPGGFASDEIGLLQTFGDQAVIAIENARLFTELKARTAELEAASQHKSEFLANMSHELRTPLNAIIGFSEVLSERMFGELNEKQDEYLKDIHASGQHLLSLINDILDLSKIEAGRMELEVTDFDLPTAIDNALTLVRERASRRGITLRPTVDHRLGQIRGDERKIKQVLLNLLANALKFTPEGGRIDVRAGLGDGVPEISVADTGVGIAAEDQEAIFEEFKQVGTAAKKVEGTGLGLALARKFIELHGGRIWVKSELGIGSTFTFTIPVRHGE